MDSEGTEQSVCIREESVQLCRGHEYYVTLRLHWWNKVFFKSKLAQTSRRGAFKLFNRQCKSLQYKLYNSKNMVNYNSVTQ